MSKQPSKPGDPDYFEPLPTELEQVVDEARSDIGRGPAKRPSAQGIADMQARIDYHTKLIGKFKAQLKGGSGSPEHLQHCQGCLTESERQLTEAQARLKEYQLQAAGQN